MAESRTLRGGKTVDYVGLSGGEKSANKSGQTLGILNDLPDGVDTEDVNILNSLEAQAAKLQLDIAVAGKRHEIMLLQEKLQSLSASPMSPAQDSQNAQKSPASVNLKELSKNKDLDHALEFFKNSHLDFISEPVEKSELKGTESSTNTGKSMTFHSIPDFIIRPNQRLCNK